MSNQDHNNKWPAFLDGLQGIKFGAGVLGKTSTIAGMLIVSAIAAMYFLRESPTMVASVFGAIFLFGVAYTALSFWYAFQNPSASVLEGSELVRYKEMELAAKDPKIIDLSAEKSVNTLPPKKITAGTQHE